MSKGSKNNIPGPQGEEAVREVIGDLEVLTNNYLERGTAIEDLAFGLLVFALTFAFRSEDQEGASHSIFLIVGSLLHNQMHRSLKDIPHTGSKH